MTGKKQRNEPKDERRDLNMPERGLKAGSSEVLMETVTRGAKPNKADAENAKVQMQDFHVTKLKSPRDVATGQAKS